KVYASTRCGIDDASGEMTSCQIEVNDETRSPTVEELEAVLTHQLGHVLGLDESSDPTAVMATERESSIGAEWRRINKDDRAGLAAIYGRPKIIDLSTRTATPAKAPAAA